MKLSLKIQLLAVTLLLVGGCMTPIDRDTLKKEIVAEIKSELKQEIKGELQREITKDFLKKQSQCEKKEAIKVQLVAENLEDKVEDQAAPGKYNLMTYFGGKLYDKEGTIHNNDLLDNDYVMVYMSAHWCGPCRAFTPKLIEFYRNHKKGANFEVIFQSSDHGLDKMIAYMNKAGMPWKATKMDFKKNGKIWKAFGVKGIPCLLLFDKAGNLLDHSCRGAGDRRGRVLNKLKELTKEK